MSLLNGNQRKEQLELQAIAFYGEDVAGQYADDRWQKAEALAGLEKDLQEFAPIEIRDKSEVLRQCAGHVALVFPQQTHAPAAQPGVDCSGGGIARLHGDEHAGGEDRIDEARGIADQRVVLTNDV